MATIQAIEAKSVHQIQSGQVIVDLCSVVKELVENGLDAGATAIEVRFKNNGLDSIEVQDNGTGIAPANYENIALKHYTSKLSNYDDLSSLQTFGFRGEALSSLCALSRFSIITAQLDEAPKGKRLEFETSGRLKSTAIFAAQKGTTVSVDELFENLPVRRKELSKNIKREYGKVLGLLHAYACVSVNVKFTVRNVMPKGKAVTVFSTKLNSTTRENIANVYGAKTLTALVPMDLALDFRPTLTQMSRTDAPTTKITVRGHISKPVFGEGRQIPDRQMFFVNGRPCGLPQIAKAINEVYKSFNVSQSPFVFADFQMDTNAYDVNVSPDKRTILLHNATILIERLKSSLTEMFDGHDQTVPQSQMQTSKLPAFRHLHVNRQSSTESNSSDFTRKSLVDSPKSALRDESVSLDDANSDEETPPNDLFHQQFRHQVSTREVTDPRASEKAEARQQKDRERMAEKVAKVMQRQADMAGGVDEYDDVAIAEDLRLRKRGDRDEEDEDVHVRDFNARMAEQRENKHSRSGLSHTDSAVSESPIASATPRVRGHSPGVVQNAFDRMRPLRAPAEIASITVGDKTVTAVIGTQPPRRHHSMLDPKHETPKRSSVEGRTSSQAQNFTQSLRRFEAPGTQAFSESGSADEDVDNDLSGGSDSDQDGIASEASEEEVDKTAYSTGAQQRLAVETESSDDSDPEYVDEAEEKLQEEARVAELIRIAEESAELPSKDSLKRANKALKGTSDRDSTAALLSHIDLDLAALQHRMTMLAAAQESVRKDASAGKEPELVVEDAESRLSLTISKKDFAAMNIVGQFNNGFIIAVRLSTTGSATTPTNRNDELFIIDQHASDEKFNFERLQQETVVGNQRMVHSVTLDLTAVEEEIVLENTATLEKNGFLIEVDMSGDQPVGRRCKLITLPLSKEVVFDTRDLDELIHLLAETPLIAESTVPRPSRVRKMFAMRACRSSIMIGRALSKKQMSTLVTHMGTIDKPWNCPHGRPTMRHLTTLNSLELWQEGDGQTEAEEDTMSTGDVWKVYAAS